MDIFIDADSRSWRPLSLKSLSFSPAVDANAGRSPAVADGAESESSATRRRHRFRQSCTCDTNNNSTRPQETRTTTELDSQCAPAESCSEVASPSSDVNSKVVTWMNSCAPPSPLSASTSPLQLQVRDGNGTETAEPQPTFWKETNRTERANVEKSNRTRSE